MKTFGSFDQLVARHLNNQKTAFNYQRILQDLQGITLKIISSLHNVYSLTGLMDQSSAALAVPTLPDADDTLSIRDMTYTFKASVSDPYEIKILGTTALQTALIARVINGLYSADVGDETQMNPYFSAEADGTDISLTSHLLGEDANNYEIISSAAHIVVTDPASGSGNYPLLRNICLDLTADRLFAADPIQIRGQSAASKSMIDKSKEDLQNLINKSMKLTDEDGSFVSFISQTAEFNTPTLGADSVVRSRADNGEDWSEELLARKGDMY